MIVNAREIVAGADIVSIIGKRVSLKRKGNDSYECPCPIHNGTSNAFKVTPSKQMYYCFSSCRDGGDVVKFLREYEKCSYTEAVEMIAAETNQVVKYNNTKDADQNYTPKGDLYSVLEKVTRHYQEELANKPEVIQYLYSRGYTDQSIAKYQIGYSKGNSVESVAPEKLLLEVGVLRKPRKEGQPPYDLLQGRVVIPLRDTFGKVIGFTGRTLQKNEQTAKYINSPETFLYRKSRCLYGYHWAKDIIRNNDGPSDLLLLEGEIKTQACLEKGQAAVSVGGTGLSGEQIAMITRLAPDRVLIAADTDAAGRAAAVRMAMEMNKICVSFEVKFAELIPDTPRPQDGKLDPDDLLAAGEGWTWRTPGTAEWLYYTFCDNQSEDDIRRSLNEIVRPFIDAIKDDIRRINEFRELSTLSGYPVSVLSRPVAKLPALIRHDAPKTVVDERMIPMHTLYATVLQISFEDIASSLKDGHNPYWCAFVDWSFLNAQLLLGLQRLLYLQKYAYQHRIPITTAIEEKSTNPAQLNFWLAQTLPYSNHHKDYTVVIPQLISECQKKEV